MDEQQKEIIEAISKWMKNLNLLLVVTSLLLVWLIVDKLMG